MKRFFFLTTFFIISTITWGQSDYAAEMANLDAMKNETYMRFFMYVKKGNVAVISPIQVCSRLYRDASFDDRIEKEANEQWLKYLKEDILAYKIRRVLEEEEMVALVFTESYRGRDKDALTEIRRFRQKKEDMSAKWREEGKIVLNDDFFTYKPSLQIEGKLKEQETKFKNILTAIREREEKRIEDEKKKEHIKQLESDPVAGQQLGGMAALIYYNEEDGDDNERSFYLKGNFGFGFLTIPVILNSYPIDAGSTAGTESKIDQAFFPTTYVGLNLAFFNDKIINWKLSPLLVFGTDINFTGIDTKGTHILYGLSTAVGIGKRVRFQLKGEYAKRNGSTKTTQEFSSNKTEEALDYNYSTLKYGAGIIYNMTGVNEFIEFTFFRENLSFLKGAGAAVYSFEIKASLGFLAVGWQHGANYPIAGKLDYPSQLSITKQNFNNFSIYVPFTLAKKPK